MKPIVLTCILLSLAFFSCTTAKAQNYVFELNPRYFSLIGLSDGGLGVDANFLIGKYFSIGGSYYSKLGDRDQGKMFGLNFKLSSDKQKRISAHGIIRVLNAKYRYELSTGEIFDNSGLGGSLGVGSDLRLSRNISWTIVQLNYLIGKDLSRQEFNGDFGFQGLSIESGFTFRLFRKK